MTKNIAPIYILFPRLIHSINGNGTAAHASCISVDSSLRGWGGLWIHSQQKRRGGRKEVRCIALHLLLPSNPELCDSMTQKGE